MGVFDDVISGDQNMDRDGNDPDELDDSDDTDHDDDGSDDGRSDRDDNDKDGDRRKRRNRPSLQRRERDRVRSLETKLDGLIQAISKGGLGVNADKDSKDTVDVDALRREVEAEVMGRTNQRLVVSEARSALKDAGFRGDASRGVRMLDLKGIDPDDQDAILDAIDDLKDDSPELFGRVRRNGRSSRSNRDDYDRDDDGPEDNRRQRESRGSGRSREGMSRDGTGGGSESDSLAANLLRAVGGSRPRR